jgi:DNA polymerase III subunit delta
VRDKKNLLQYVSNPVEFTILVLIHNGQISNPDTELYRELLEAGFLYEAKELKGKNLISWLINYTESKGKVLSEENAQLFVDIAGDNRSMLEVQLEKIFTFIGDEKEIDHLAITNLSSSLKQYSIFDLQNAIGKKDKATAMKIAMKMMESGEQPTYIIFMLTRYFTGLSRMNELKEKNIPVQAAARIVGTHQFYYKDYENARKLYSDEKVHNAAQSLLKAELSIKTTSADPKNIVSVLIAEIMQ